MTTKEKLHIRELATNFITRNFDRIEYVVEKQMNSEREIRFVATSNTDSDLQDSIMMEVNYTKSGPLEYKLWVVFTRRNENGIVKEKCSMENGGLSKKVQDQLVKVIMEELKAFAIDKIFSNIDKIFSNYKK